MVGDCDRITFLSGRWVAVMDLVAFVAHPDQHGQDKTERPADYEDFDIHFELDLEFASVVEKVMSFIHCVIFL